MRLIISAIFLPPLFGGVGTLPLIVEANRGQAENHFVAIARHSTMRMGFSADGVAFLPGRHRVEMRFGGGQAVTPELEGRLGSHSNYHGNGRSLAGIPHYGRVRYRDVWPGIDVVVYERDRRVEYDFEVAPGADPSRIRLRFDGARRVELTAEGALGIETAAGRLEHLAPRIHQPGGSREVAGRFRLEGENEVRFELGTYDGTRRLVIDPVVKYASYVGTHLADYGRGIATGASERILVTGTEEPTYLVPDVFVAAFSGNGETLHWLTTLRGATQDEVKGIAADAAGNAYVVGRTFSLTVTPGYNAPLTSDGSIFVARLDTAGAVSYLARFGGSAEAAAITADPAGNVYITGRPLDGFPVTPGAYSSSFGLRTSFVTKIDATGKNIVYSTLLPETTAAGIAVNGAGEVHLAGEATTGFPAKPGTIGTYCDSSSGFVAKLASSGNALLTATCLPENAGRIQVDADGNMVVVSSFFTNVFRVRKLDPTASVMLYNTLVGSCWGSESRGLALDAAGQAFVLCGQDNRTLLARVTAAGQVASYWLGPEHILAAGVTVTAAGYAALTGTVNSAVLPVTPEAYDSTLGGYLDAFLMIVDLSDTTKITHTVTTVPAGLNIAVDGTSYPSPQTFEWFVGSEHVVGAPSPQTPVDGVRHVAQESSVTVRPTVGGSTTTQLAFNSFYRITATVNPLGAGSFTGATEDGYYPSASGFRLWPMANPFYRFSHWSGDINSTEPVVTQPLTGPMNVTAHFAGCNPLFLVPTFVVEPTRMWRTTYHRPDIAADCPWALHFQTPWLTAQAHSGRLALLASTHSGPQPRKATFNLGTQAITVVQKTPSASWRETNGTLRIYQYDATQAVGKTGAFDGETASTQTLDGDTITAVRDRWGGVWVGVFSGQTQVWGALTFLGGAAVGTPAITMTPQGTAYIAIRDRWDSYWVTGFTPGGAAGAWSHLGGVFATDPAIASSADSVYLIGKDKWNGMWSNRRSGSNWQGWRFGGAIVKGKPSVVVGSDNIAYIAARDNWDAVWTGRVNGETWLGWMPVQGLVNQDPQIVALPGAVRVVSLDGSGNIWHRAFAFLYGEWGAWTQRWAALSDFSACSIGLELWAVGRTKAAAHPEWYSLDNISYRSLPLAAATPLSCAPR